jgi:hypothetical protein
MANITEIGQSVNVFDIFSNINEASNGWFVGLLLITLWVLIIVLTRNSGLDFVKSSVFASFICVIIGLMFWALQMISFTYLIIFVVMLIINIFILFKG